MMRYLATAAKLILIAVLMLQSPSLTYGQLPIASFFYDERGTIVRQEQDTNGDGKMDRWTYYNKQGQVERVEQDLNFDGKADSIVYYEAGRPVRQEVASKNDGQIDTWYFYGANGEIERRGQDRKSTRFGSIMKTASRCAVRKIPRRPASRIA